MKFSDYTPFVRPETAGAPDFLIERAVRESATEFCRRTGAYIPEPENITIIKGINEYDVTVPAGTELNYITDVFANQKKLQPVSYNELLERLGDETEQGTPKYYSQRDNKSFFVAPIPSEADTFRVLYSLKPTSTSKSIPDSVGKEYQEAITQGALYRLQMMPDQPFSNPGAAGSNRQLFEREVGRTVRQVKYGFSGGSLKVRYRSFI
jgi:hypothetical protein|tara:strand:+ start:1142 stop:1765 length:624 start_codon:yes stop_codon:yes gene_type:complete